MTKRQKRLIESAKASGECFVCLGTNGKAEWECHKGKEVLKLCDPCKKYVQTQNEIERRIELALMYPENNFQVFKYTLGMKPTVPELRFTKI